MASRAVLQPVNWLRLATASTRPRVWAAFFTYPTLPCLMALELHHPCPRTMGWRIRTLARAVPTSLLAIMAASLTRSGNRMGLRPARKRRLIAASGFVALAALASPAGAQTQWTPVGG